MLFSLPCSGKQSVQGQIKTKTEESGSDRVKLDCDCTVGFCWTFLFYFKKKKYPYFFSIWNLGKTQISMVTLSLSKKDENKQKNRAITNVRMTFPLQN